MPKTILIIMLLLAACNQASTPEPRPRDGSAFIPWPDGASSAPYLDLASCRTRTDIANVPQYDGEVWRFGTSTEAIRCALPVGEQDYMMGWHVWGRHTIAGPAKTVACLQRLEVFMVEAVPQHVNVEYGDALSCRSSTFATSIGEFDLLGLMYAEPWYSVVDNALSIEIRSNGQPGDIVGAAQIYIVKP